MSKAGKWGGQVLNPDSGLQPCHSMAPQSAPCFTHCSSTVNVGEVGKSVESGNVFCLLKVCSEKQVKNISEGDL